MGLIIPTLRGGCCCCCGGAGFGLGGAGATSVAGGTGASLALAPVILLPSALAAGAESVLQFPAGAVAGQRYRAPGDVYARLKRAEKEKFKVVAHCGHDRDCLPSSWVEVGYGLTLHNARSWARLGSGRFVDIFTEPGGALVSRIEGSQADYAVWTPDDRDETELRAIQTSPHAGRFGFLPQ